MFSIRWKQPIPIKKVWNDGSIDSIWQKAIKVITKIANILKVFQNENYFSQSF